MSEIDLERFDEFVVHRLPALYRYAQTLTGHRQDAEDLVQEALARTGASWWRLKRRDDPEGYVRTTMVRIMVNRWRRPMREHPVPEPPDQPAEDPALDRVTADAGFDAVLRGLSPRMRAVLVLRYVDQLHDAEIAKVLGCSAGTVRSLASRALGKLRATVDAEESSHG